ncbi:MAG: hypothetical protein ACO1OT_12960 [Heyndrickxia sp.]
MNLKKALVGCTLAFSLAVGGVFVTNGKGHSNAEGESFPPINGGKNVNSVYKVAEGESFPPINGPVTGGKTRSTFHINGESFPPINGGGRTL